MFPFPKTANSIPDNKTPIPDKSQNSMPGNPNHWFE
jgi:hypothetical protein